MIPVARPLLGAAERDAVLQVLDSGALAQGPWTRALEAEFASVCGTEHAVAVSSGTAALHLALLGASVGPGDEVITTPFTFVATVNAILLVGARPVFVDIDPATFTLDPGLVAAALTERTKAVLPVHLFGQMCDTASLLDVTRDAGLLLVEDASQAVGATDGDGAWRAGGVGHVGTFSLYATKNVTSAEGGVLTTDDGRLAERVRRLRDHGATAQRTYVEVGYNYRLSDLHAAVGVAQVGRLAEFTERRRANARALAEGIHVVQPPTVRQGAGHVWHHYAVRVPPPADRATVMARLSAAGVQSASHYPVPVHRLPHVRAVVGDVQLPEAERAAREVLCLPVHPALSAEDVATVVDAVNTSW